MESEQQEKLIRWRLLLGSESEAELNSLGKEPFNQEQFMLDQALASIYGIEGEIIPDGTAKSQSLPRLVRWLGDIRSLFDKETVAIIQRDAVERKGLKHLLTEPELLENLQADINIASTILMLKDQIPAKSKEAVRSYIRRIVEQISKLFADNLHRAVAAAVNRKIHSPLSSSAIDFAYTIKRSLKNFNTELGTIIPERVYFFERLKRSNRWQIILDIDQSGSMGSSIIYSSIMACILASIPSLQTNVVAFDTNVLDLTSLCSDPVDLLFGFQMGGGTNIAKSLAYCRTLIHQPDKTLLFLISDLEEGGNRASLLQYLEDMKASGVNVVVLLAIADGGAPYYNAATAQKIANYSIPCFACAPERLPELLERAIKKQDLSVFQMKGKT
ncbi:MAG: VWA domain-containing protein [Candidatus Bruticola sp.]